MAKLPTFPLENLRARFAYDPIDGSLTRKVSLSNFVKPGSPAGTLTSIAGTAAVNLAASLARTASGSAAPAISAASSAAFCSASSARAWRTSANAAFASRSEAPASNCSIAKRLAAGSAALAKSISEPAGEGGGHGDERIRLAGHGRKLRAGDRVELLGQPVLVLGSDPT